MNTVTKLGLGLMTTVAFAVQAQVNLKALDRDMSGPRSKVLVLGSVHLREMKDLNPQALDGLLDKLAAFRPQIVTVEQQSSVECALVAHLPDKFGSYNCQATDKAKAATGLDLPAAVGQVDQMLWTWPARPSAAQRRHLAAVYLAAGERTSAYVQWLQLGVTERRADEHLKPELVEILSGLAANTDEVIQIGARLAARLGLSGVRATDDHTGDNIEVDDTKAFGRSLEAAWAQAGTPSRDADKQVATLKTARDLLPLYRFINSPSFLQKSADANVGAALRADSPEGYPQMFVAGWEIRNLRMVANIRETFRERPGVRVLSIVGVAHKPYFDQWLGQMSGIDIVDTLGVLK